MRVGAELLAGPSLRRVGAEEHRVARHELEVRGLVRARGGLVPSIEGRAHRVLLLGARADRGRREEPELASGLDARAAAGSEGESDEEERAPHASVIPSSSSLL